MLNIFLLAAASLVLPAAPQAIAVGDVDGDGSAELVALMVFPERGSQAQISPYEEGVVEVKVVPSIEERRELWLFEFDGKKLWKSGEALEVGPELLALQGLRAGEPVVALTDSGPALVMTRPDEGSDRQLELQLLADVPPLFAGARSTFTGFPFYRDYDAEPPADVLVPTEGGFTLVDTKGARRELEAPLAEAQAGFAARLIVALPRVLDLDGDGREDLLHVAGVSGRWQRPRAALARGLPEGSFAKSRTWDLDGILEESETEKEKGEERDLQDVLDLDRDGTLEAAVSVSPRDADSLRDALRLVRGKPGRMLLFALGHDGSVAGEPESILDYEGHLWPLNQEGGWLSPFRDIDGDGRAELMSLTIQFGMFGVARAVAAGTLRARIEPRLYALGDRGYEEISRAVPEATFKADLSEFDLSRFKDFPADINGDGALDMVDVAGERVEITYAEEGPRFGKEPSSVIRLEDKLAGAGGLRFLDVDGQAPLDIVAIEPLEREEDNPARPARLEIVLMGVER